MNVFASAGSQRWLQIAVNKKPQLLESALRRSGAIGRKSFDYLDVSDNFREYRDNVALSKVGIANLKKPLEEFWPGRGPVRDALGTAADQLTIFIEAKAHIPEAASPATKASAESFELIERSLGDARRFYAPKARAIWTSLYAPLGSPDGCP